MLKFNNILKCKTQKDIDDYIDSLKNEVYDSYHIEYFNSEIDHTDEPTINYESFFIEVFISNIGGVIASIVIDYDRFNKKDIIIKSYKFNSYIIEKYK